MRSRALVVLLIFSITMLFIPLSAGAASAPEQASPKLSAGAGAASSSNYEKAIDLKILGLLATKPANFELDRPPKRAEGLAMLIRLLGKENEVLQGDYKHPFKDVPTWADKYVGYAYQNGIVRGKSSDTYGAHDPMTAKQYVALVLRSIGYKDGVDFEYNQALDKAVEIGLLSRSEANELKNRSVFLRDDLVAVSYNALTVKIKGSSRTLAEKLVDTDKSVFRPAAELLGLYPSDFERQYGDVLSFSPRRTSYGYVIRNTDDLVKFITKMLVNHTSSAELDITDFSGDIKKEFQNAFDVALKASEGITRVPCSVKLREYEINSSRRRMNLTLTYRDSESMYSSNRAKAKTALDKARHIVAERISADMTDFEKEKILHDYIVSNTAYDHENYKRNTLSEDVFEEYGCLVLGKAVCEGYAEAIKLLCDLAGIECIIVAGTPVSNSAEGHAWNIVKIDGEYYHLDATNNDTMTKDGTEILIYSYFNLTDSEMMKFYEWETSQYPKCRSTRNNYYNKYGLVADDTESLRRVLTAAIEKRSPVIEVKISNYTQNTFSVMKDMIINSRAIIQYRYTINAELGIVQILNIKYIDQ